MMRLLVCVALLGLLPSPQAKGEIVDDRGSLKGLTAVYVLVEDIGDTGGRLTRETLTTDVQLRLRQLGIKVLDKSVPDAGALYLNVNIERDQSGHLFV